MKLIYRKKLITNCNRYNDLNELFNLGEHIYIIYYPCVTCSHTNSCDYICGPLFKKRSLTFYKFCEHFKDKDIP